MDLTLKQMRILSAVVAAGSIGRATRLTGLSQPTISQQLAKMERALGAQLVVRSRESELELTPAGDFWYRAALETLERLDAYEAVHAQRFSGDRLAIRFGATPSLRGRFLREAARLASRDESFTQFEFVWAINSAEVMELLMVRRINCAVVSENAVEPYRPSLSVAPIFMDRVIWVVPQSVSHDAVEDALNARKESPKTPPALGRIANVGAVAPWRGLSESWYRAHLPFATPFFRCMTHQATVELVAEGLATCHAPMSLFPNLPESLLRTLRLYDIGGIARSAVLVMPRQNLSLSPYARFSRDLLDFAAREYAREMPTDHLVRLPVTPTV